MKKLLLLLTVVFIGIGTFSQTTNFHYTASKLVVTQFNNASENYDLFRKDTTTVFDIETRVGYAKITNQTTGKVSVITFQTQAFDKRYNTEGGFTTLYKGTLASGTPIIIMYSFSKDLTLDMLIIGDEDLNRIVAYAGLTYRGER